MCEDNETHFLTQQLQKSHTSTSSLPLEEKVKKVKQEYCKIFDSLNKRQLDFMEKTLLYVQAKLPTFVENNSVNSFSPVMNVPPNKNIDHQRRFYSTKKEKKSKKLIIVPTSEEKNSIALSMLLKDHTEKT